MVEILKENCKNKDSFVCKASTTPCERCGFWCSKNDPAPAITIEEVHKEMKKARESLGVKDGK